MALERLIHLGQPFPSNAGKLINDSIMSLAFAIPLAVEATLTEDAPEGQRGPEVYTESDLVADELHSIAGSAEREEQTVEDTIDSIRKIVQRYEDTKSDTIPSLESVDPE